MRGLSELEDPVKGIERAITEPMELHITPPSALRIRGNAEYACKWFKEQSELYIKATGANTLEDEQNNPLLLTVAGQKC